MRGFGLIGHPIHASKSPQLYQEIWYREGVTDAAYTLYPTWEAETLLILAQDPDLHGVNVTIPLKQAVMPLLTELTPEAQAVGAVNTIAILSPTQLIGHNTDVAGFTQALVAEQEHWLSEPKALICGTGGASKAVAYALGQLNIPYTIVGRQAAVGVLAYEEVGNLGAQGYNLLVNATPLGRYGLAGQQPAMAYETLPEGSLLIDLTYGDEPSLMMQTCKAYGAYVIDGMPMLKAQAQAAWDWWQRVGG